MNFMNLMNCCPKFLNGFEAAIEYLGRSQKVIWKIDKILHSKFMQYQMILKAKKPNDLQPCKDQKHLIQKGIMYRTCG